MPAELEWRTRKERIDKKLRALKWDIIDYKSSLNPAKLDACAVREYPTANGPADYALFVKGMLLGIIEAKKVSVGAQNVLEQAKRYARGAFDGPGNWGGYRVPFLFSSNGETVWFIDVREEKNLSRQLKNFHTAEALNEFYKRSIAISCTWFGSNPVNQIAKLRPYQERAIEKMEEALAKGKREMLVAMATGTGKTFLTVSQVYRLLESSFAKRILFLVDRKALAAQAVKAFASFQTPKGMKFDREYEVYSQRFQKEDFGDDEPYNSKLLPNEYLTAPNEKHTFIYVCTIQRMAINLFGKEEDPDSEPGTEPIDDSLEDVDKVDIPIHAFDVVIADECHRGYTARQTSRWRSVIEYFDAVKLGLTATPASHTLGLFREVVFRYATDEAIKEGYLVDYDAVKIKSDVRINGVFLHEGETVGVIDTETGTHIYDTLEDEREFQTTEIEEKITAPDSNRKIIMQIADYAYKHEEATGQFPKMLIFAANDLPHTSHADQLVRICREVFDRGDDFVQKITGSPSVDRPLQRIREFRNRPKPMIVVTVDMLSTGVDIPSLEFLVFLRPVKSRILWFQMLGRGTRLCPDIYKTNFTVFDCFDGTLINYFKNTGDLVIEPPQKDPVPLEKVIDNIYQNVDRDYNVNVLVKRLHRIEKSMNGEARDKFAAYIPNGDMEKFSRELAVKIKTDFTNTMRLLRDKDFQELLKNYPKAKRTFLVGYDVVDNVSSEVMIHAGSEYQKPEDYLESFSRFVKENPEQIEAIRILLERPKEWKTEVLNELREKLARNKFPERELQKAHKLVNNKALADIISIVKHAAKEIEPVLTAEERVDRAMRRVMSEKDFNEEQIGWLELVREHLITNLTLEMKDFEDIPAFERRGGKKKAKELFKDKLEALIKEINESIAS